MHKVSEVVNLCFALELFGNYGCRNSEIKVLNIVVICWNLIYCAILWYCLSLFWAFHLSSILYLPIFLWDDLNWWMLLCFSLWVSLSVSFLILFTVSDFNMTHTILLHIWVIQGSVILQYGCYFTCFKFG